MNWPRVVLQRHFRVLGVLYQGLDGRTVGKVPWNANDLGLVRPRDEAYQASGCSGSPEGIGNGCTIGIDAI